MKAPKARASSLNFHKLVRKSLGRCVPLCDRSLLHKKTLRTRMQTILSHTNSPFIIINRLDDMSLGDDDDFWNTSSVKAFNFDDDDQQQQQQNSNHNYQHQQSQQQSAGNQHQVKTLNSVLATKAPSNEPFLKPSIILCHGRNKINLLIDYLDRDNDKLNQPRTKRDPKAYINDIVNEGAPIDFSPYKSKSEKLLLLDCAICCCDGNTITAATIFLSKTLKQSIFIDELRRRPIAVNHYINYLEINERSREALELANALQRDDKNK